MMSGSEVDVRALAALLYPRQAREEDSDEELHPTHSVTPGDLLGTHSTQGKQQQRPSQPASQPAGAAATPAEDAREAPLDEGGSSDPRPQPHYTVTFRERLTPSQVYLPISMGRVGEEDVVVRVELPGELLTEVTLEVTSTTLNLASPSHHLHFALPRPVNQRKGVATWDPTTHTLVVTLPTVHSAPLLQPTTQ